MLLVLGAAGCSSEEVDDRTSILMGATFSTTGVSAVSTWGNAFDLAALDASEGLKQAGFPTGKRLKFDTAIMDTSNKVDITVASATKMVKEQGAKMIINGTSADTVALGKLEYDDKPDNDLAVPVVCVACSSPSLHNKGAASTTGDPAVDVPVTGAYHNDQKWIFGLAMSSVPQSVVLWNILRDATPDGNIPGDLNGDGLVKISTIALDDAFGTGFQGAMKKVVDAATNKGITDGIIKYEETRHPKDADLSSYDWSGALALLTDNKTNNVEDGVPDALIEFTFPQFSLALVKAYTGDVPFLHTPACARAPSSSRRRTRSRARMVRRTCPATARRAWLSTRGSRMSSGGRGRASGTPTFMTAASCSVWPRSRRPWTWTIRPPSRARRFATPCSPSTIPQVS
jgi:ribosomal protein L11